MSAPDVATRDRAVAMLTASAVAPTPPLTPTKAKVWLTAGEAWWATIRVIAASSSAWVTGSASHSLAPARIAERIRSGSSVFETIRIPVVGCWRLNAPSAGGTLDWPRKSTISTSACRVVACAIAGSCANGTSDGAAPHERTTPSSSRSVLPATVIFRLTRPLSSREERRSQERRPVSDHWLPHHDAAGRDRDLSVDRCTRYLLDEERHEVDDSNLRCRASRPPCVHVPIQIEHGKDNQARRHRRARGCSHRATVPHLTLRTQLFPCRERVRGEPCRSG